MLGDWLIRTRALFRRDAVENELDTEVRFHFDRQVEKYIGSGLTPEEAKRRARLQFGGLDQIKEECRDARGVRFIETLFQDVRFACRMLYKSPGFTAVAVLTLALGIGVNTAIFNAARATLFEPLPVRGADRLVVIWINNLEHGWSRIGPTGQDYLDWKQQSTSFEDFYLFEHGTGTVTGQGEPEQATGLRVTTNFGDFFGIEPALRTDLPPGRGRRTAQLRDSRLRVLATALRFRPVGGWPGNDVERRTVHGYRSSATAR